MALPETIAIGGVIQRKSEVINTMPAVPDPGSVQERGQQLFLDLILVRPRLDQQLFVLHSQLFDLLFEELLAVPDLLVILVGQKQLVL